MTTLYELLQQYTTLPYERLLDMGRLYLADLSKILQKHFDGDFDRSRDIAFRLLGACIGADGSLSDLEVTYVNDLLGKPHSAAEIKVLMEHYATEESIDALDKVADLLPNKEKAILLSACLCFLAVDKNIDAKEMRFIQKLIDTE